MIGKRFAVVILGLALLCAVPAGALSFTENFSGGTSNWTNAADGALTWVDGVGPDGDGFVESSTFGAINDPGTVLFRGNALNGASGGGFTGDWTGGAVTEISAFVYHELAVPVNYFFRITTGINFPAHAGVVPIPVLPFTWTEISVDIDPLNPLLVSEFGTFEQTFGDVTNVQVGASVPLAFEGVPFVARLDAVSIVPEPSTGLLLGMGITGLALRSRRRTRR